MFWYYWRSEVFFPPKKNNKCKYNLEATVYLLVTYIRLLFLSADKKSSLSGFAGLWHSQSNSLNSGHEIRSGCPLGLKVVYIITKTRNAPIHAFGRNPLFQSSWKLNRLCLQKANRKTFGRKAVVWLKDCSVARNLLFDLRTYIYRQTTEVETTSSWSFGKADRKMGKRVINPLYSYKFKP